MQRGMPQFLQFKHYAEYIRIVVDNAVYRLWMSSSVAEIFAIEM